MEYTFEFRRYRLPFRVPLRTGHGPWSEREGVLVRLTGAEGATGYGEAAPIPWFGTETADEVAAACGALGKKVDDGRLDAVASRLDCLRHALTAARAAGRGQSLTGSDYRPVAALLPAGRAAIAVVTERAEAGFRVFKWKVGVGDVADELALLDDVCAALPEGAKLRLDANGAWNRRQAERWLERCVDRPVEFVEQPCHSARTESEAQRRKTEDLLLGLAAEYPTPLALDESIAGEADVARWIGAGWRGIYVVKPALLGDVDGTLGRLTTVKADVVFSSAIETGVGARSALAAAFGWKGPARALGFGVWPQFADARLDGPALTPFLRWEDVERINPEAIWNALS